MFWFSANRARFLAALRFIALRSSSESPPQTPASCPLSSAQAKQGSFTEHLAQIFLARKIIKIFNNKGKLLICGNGGSCADASHFAGELKPRQRSPRATAKGEDGDDTTKTDRRERSY